MRKARSLIAVFLVVLIQITPGPLGLRRAHADLPMYTGGGEWTDMTSSNGVTTMIRQGHDKDGSISPPTVDSATAKVSMPLDTGYVYQDKTTGQKAFVQSSTGGIMEVDLASGKAKEIVSSNPSEYPQLSPIYNSAAIPIPITSTPAPGNVFSDSSGNHYITTVGPTLLVGTTYFLNTVSRSSAIASIMTSRISVGGERYILPYTYMYWNFQYTNIGDGRCGLTYNYCTITAANTSDTVNPLPASGDSLDPGKISSGLTQSGFPGKGSLNGEIIRVGEKGAGNVEGRVGGGYGGSGSGTGVVPSDIPNMPGYGGSAGDGSGSDPSIPQDPNAPTDPTNNNDPTTDIPYSPQPDGDAYTLDEVDFGKRLDDFVSGAKSSSLFSLPHSAFGDIPGGGSSIMTIQGGQTFGTHTFDFADMANMWVTLRGVILTIFSSVSVRILCLKR